MHGILLSTIHRMPLRQPLRGDLLIVGASGKPSMSSDKQRGRRRTRTIQR